MIFNINSFFLIYFLYILAISKFKKHNIYEKQYNKKFQFINYILSIYILKINI